MHENAKGPRLQDLHAASDVIARCVATDQATRELAQSLRKRLIHAIKTQDAISAEEMVSLRALEASLNPPPGGARPVHSATVAVEAAAPDSSA